MSEIETVIAQFQGKDYAIDVLKKDKLVAGALRTKGMWESWIAELVHKVQKPGDVCCDVGANIGLHTIFMSEQCDTGRVLAFEPLPVTASLLQSNLDRHGCDNVEVHRVALSDREGEARLTVDEEWLGNARILDDGIDPHGLFTDTIGLNLGEVPIRTARMDDLLTKAGISQVDLIKVDVEGHENAFFDGAEATIAANPEMLYVTEHAPTAHDTHNNYETDAFRISDYDYYTRCRRYFGFCYLIERNHALVLVENYAMLRLLIMRGRGVEDLLFCNALPKVLEDAVKFAPDIDQVPLPVSRGFFLPQGTAQVLNRYRDGWAKVGLVKPWCQSGMVVQTAQPVRATLTFHKPRAQHLTGRGKIAVNDEIHSLDVSQGNQELVLELSPGRSSVFIETYGFMVPSRDLNSPNDHREVGLKWTVEFTE